MPRWIAVSPIQKPSQIRFDSFLHRVSPFPTGPSRRVQPRAEQRIQVDHGLHGFVLPHNFPAKPRLKIPRPLSAVGNVPLPSSRHSHGGTFSRAPCRSQL
jgi:hypothetical protein